MSRFETIDVSHSGHVVTISLDRPDVRNAFNARMIADLTEAFTNLALRDDLRAAVLRGNGPSFSAGADVTWMRASLGFSETENLEDARRMSDMFHAVDSLPIPLIARVHGAALGGGMGLIAVCDIVIAAEDALFGFTEAKLGIIPAVISRFVLPKTGESWARALYLTGERFGPDVARQIGLVHWVTPADALDAVVEEKMALLLTSGPAAAREAKSLIVRARGLDTFAMRELTAERIAAVRTTAEGQEGLRAFLEKRKPGWLPDGSGA